MLEVEVSEHGVCDLEGLGVERLGVARLGAGDSEMNVPAVDELDVTIFDAGVLGFLKELGLENVPAAGAKGCTDDFPVFELICLYEKHQH